MIKSPLLISSPRRGFLGGLSLVVDSVTELEFSHLIFRSVVQWLGISGKGWELVYNLDLKYLFILFGYFEYHCESEITLVSLVIAILFVNVTLFP